MKEIESLFDKVYSPSDLDKNSKTVELIDKDDVSTKFVVASSVPKIVQQLLSPGTTMFFYARFKCHSLVYTISKTHEGNSQVLYYPDGNTSSKPVAGIITFIYSEKIKSMIQPVAAVWRLVPVGSDSLDPFSKYSHLSDGISIPPTWLLCH